ncbi:MAG: endonuclease/exonuclease/phosphatase family protein [Muribaculaceae bacterium]|nr:endonuclease/exonuclease/phosphatase family protein [Muribaculaceae bacterium]
MRKLIRILLLVSSVVAGICFVGAALGGNVDPRVWSWPGVLTMSFTVWCAVLAVVTALSGLNRSWLPFGICVAAWMAGWSGVRAVSPINLSRDPSGDGPVLSVMTYNVFGLRDYTDVPIEEVNQTVSAILASGADVVALQECVSLEKPLPMLGYTSAQADSIKNAYPYRRFNGNGMAILSRYPVKSIKIKEKPEGTAVFAGWKIDVDGIRVDLYSVHLQSFGLNSNDKQLYRRLTDGGDLKHNVKEARHELIPKVTHALRCHADEGEMLQRIIEADTCSRVILCGDFNDVPGSYVATQLQKQCGLKGAWAGGGFGPTWTYRANRFYFHIDQMLYRGMERPLQTRRLRIGQSDHYPLESTFQL